MKLKTKILLISLLPIIILGVAVYILTTNRTANGIYRQAYDGMEATSIAVKDIFEAGGYQGDYRIDDNGYLWKGYMLNISRADDIVDKIKNETGMEVAVYYGDEQKLTTLTDSDGNRLTETKAGDRVVQVVLEQGNTYRARNVEIQGEKYIVYYTPVYQDGTQDVIGMIFLGMSMKNVTSIIDEISRQILLIILLVIIITAIVVVILVNRIVAALDRSMGVLNELSRGNLAVTVDPKILKRKDEIGELGNGILNLKNELQRMIGMIRDKSRNLNDESVDLQRLSDSVYEIMQEVDRAAQEMGESCTSQAHDAAKASDNVGSMGDMIGENNREVQELGKISDTIKEVAELAVQELESLSQVMQTVRDSILYLSEQTGLTESSVEKISSATEMISAIASETNLLSLNASIEAARAGEQGKGFAVVASEIQKLSEQSNDAVEDIRVMIENLITNSSNTMERMEDVKLAIETQEKNIQKTEQAFDSVQKGIKESVSRVEAILNQMNSLETVRNETIDSVQGSATIAQQNAASVQQIMASIENIYQELGTVSERTRHLGELSKDMKSSIDIFKG